MDDISIHIESLNKIYRNPLSGLREWFGKTSQSVSAIQNVSLTIHSGEIFGLVGRNGQGKTTLLKIISGLIEPTSGNVEVFGFNPIHHRHEIKKRIGLVTSDERCFYWRLTGWDNLCFFSRLHGVSSAQFKQRMKYLIEQFELTDLIHRKFHEYSTGNKQRLALVRALLHNPQILLLDEPTRSLDPITADRLREHLVEWARSSNQRTILITSHDLNEIESLCHRIAFLHCGQVKACATLQELRNQYFQPDQVRIQIRKISTDQFSSIISNIKPELSWNSNQSDRIEIQFAHQNGNGALNHVLNKLVSNGVEIMDISYQRFGLRNMMDQIEDGG